jgi:hypothetical protein
MIVGAILFQLVRFLNNCKTQTEHIYNHLHRNVVAQMCQINANDVTIGLGPIDTTRSAINTTNTKLKSIYNHGS